LKIVHVINYFQHQLGYQEYFLAKEHAKAGHDVTVITSNKYFPFPDYENTVKSILGERVFDPGEEEIDGFKVIRLRGIFEQPGRRIWLMGMVKIINRLRPDLIICHGEYTYYTFVLSILKKLCHFKLIVDSHTHPHDNPNPEKTQSFISKALFIAFRLIVWTRKDIVLISTTTWNYAFLIDKFRFSNNNLQLIANGSDIERFRPDSRNKIKMRNRLCLDKEEIVIIYSGKISKEKDPLIIFKVIENLIEQYRIQLLVVGNIQRDYEKIFSKYKSEHSNVITHVPAVPNNELQYYYQAADIGCWPFQSSMSAIDAMACGLPIIVVDELKDRLSNNNGFGIREGNIEDLWKAIKKLVEDKILREEMGKRGREMVEKEMSWEKVAKRFIDIAFQYS